MEQKLKEYGFDDWQIKKLIEQVVLKTSHGEYKVVNNELYIKRCNESIFSKINL